MINCIIVDDEPKSRESLKILLEDFCQNVGVKALCQDVAEAVEAIQTHKPDVVFLDIHLQRETGFDLLTRLNDVNFEVIFTTAYSEYAIKAFKFSAIDYLLKPIDIEELKRALAKVEKTHERYYIRQAQATHPEFKSAFYRKLQACAPHVRWTGVRESKRHPLLRSVQQLYPYLHIRR